MKGKKDKKAEAAKKVGAPLSHLDCSYCGPASCMRRANCDALFFLCRTPALRASCVGKFCCFRDSCRLALQGLRIPLAGRLN